MSMKDIFQIKAASDEKDVFISEPAVLDIHFHFLFRVFGGGC